MKILILNNYYYPHMEGGAEFSVKILAEALVHEGNEVTVISMDGAPETDLLSCELINGVKVYRSYSKHLYRRRILKNKTHSIDKFFNGINSIYNPKMNCALKTLIKLIKPDIVHTQNMVSMSYWIWKYSYKRNIPTVHTIRDYWLLDPTTNIGQSPKLFEILFRAYHKRLSNKYVDFVTSPSDRTLRIFEKYGYFKNSNKQTIVNAISFDPILLAECISEKMNRKIDFVRFIFAGKVTETKGIKLLIKAFIESNTNAQLVICGNGDLNSWISDKNAFNIVQKGRVSQEKLFQEYKKADVLIVPSLWEEPFGRIVIEGAQYGLPTIGSNKGGIPEIIRNTKYGSIFNSDSKEELIRLIQKYADRAYLNYLYSRGPQNLEDYSIKKQTSNFGKVYNSLTKSGDN